VAAIRQGLVVLLGVRIGDSTDDSNYLAEKITNLRIFPDLTGKLNLSLQDIGAEILVVSQFTLLANTRKGRRPSFTEAAPPEIAEHLIETFVHYLLSAGLSAKTGSFQKHMLVEIHNDGPVTILIDSEDRFKPRH